MGNGTLLGGGGKPLPIEPLPGSDNTFVDEPDITTVLSVEVGDAQSADFVPKIDVKAWENECSVSLKLSPPEGRELEKGEIDIQESRIVWNGTEKKAGFSKISPSDEMPEGGMEFDVTLDKRPDRDRVSFDLDFHNAVFYRQPYMQERIGQEGVVTATDTEGYDGNGNVIIQCPENICGSIAVYHASPPVNIAGDKVYKSGKIGHIYRPKIFDAEGNWAWGALSVSIDFEKGNNLYVDIPSDFLDKAVFPIVVDPTFGYTTAGATQTALLGFPICHVGAALIYTASGFQRIVKFSAYAVGTSLDMAVYTVPSGTPVTRLAAGVSITLNGTPGWRDSAALSQNMTASTIYGCAAGNFSSARMYLDTGTGNQRSAETRSGALQTPWSSAGFSTALYSMYATYENYGTLSGSRITESSGTVKASLSIRTTGSRATGGTGAPKASISKAVSGSRASGASGTVSPAASKSLAGSRKTSASGSAKVSVSISLTGKRAATAPGTAIPSMSKNVSGESGTLSEGNVSAEFESPLTGENMTAAGGILDKSGEVPLSGDGAAIAQGIECPCINVRLTGERKITSTGNLQGLKGAVSLYNGLNFYYQVATGTDPVRFKAGATTYAIPLIAASNDHAGCVRIKESGTVYALKLEK